jgi:hypothetical protein
MARHPTFKQHLLRAIRDHGSYLDGLASVQDVVDIYRAASANFASGTAAVDPTLSHDKMHWAIMLLRGRRTGDGIAISKAFRHYPSLKELNLAADDGPLTALIATLARTSIADQIREINECTTMAEVRKIAKKETLRRRAAAWAPRRRTAKALAILDPQGLPAASFSEGARLLRDFWTPAFTGRDTDLAIFDSFAAFVQEAPEDITWEIDFGDFQQILMQMGDSAPGPDGISYAALQAAPPSIHRFLYDCYLDVLRGVPLPASFNESFLIFLPKGEVDADSFHTARTPDTTRPLNLSNTVAKLVAAALNRSLSELAQRTVAERQRGFIRGRCIVDNIIEVDHFLCRAAQYYADTHGLILLDIKVAFPSLRQQWMF